MPNEVTQLAFAHHDNEYFVTQTTMRFDPRDRSSSIESTLINSGGVVSRPQRLL